MARILVVDDSGLSRRVLRRILEPAGHEVVEAEDGMSALERYYLDRPDVVMLDLTMRGLNGIDVLDRLRALDPHAAVVIASADVQRSSRELATAGGARGFVTKPFSADSVLDAVQAALVGGAR